MNKLEKQLKDKKWRLSHLYKIIDKYSNLVVFQPNKSQKKFAKNRHCRDIILKARQEGFTTLACIENLDGCLFNSNYNAVIIAQDKEAQITIFKKVKKAWENIDQDLKEYMGWTVHTDKANELSWEHGSRIRVALSSRSDTVNSLHVSEFGKICKKYPEKAKEIISGAFPSVVPNGTITIESTAEGEIGSFYGMFWDYWKKTTLTEKDFKSHFFPWFDHPEYTSIANIELPQEMLDYQNKLGLTKGQITWYYLESKIQKELMKQEYPSTPEEAFVSSGNKFFDVEVLGKQETIEGDKINDWTYFKDYKYGHTYVLGADVSEGVGRDYSTCVILDVTDNIEVAAVYKSNRIPADNFAYEIKNGGIMYGNCLVAPERNNHGHTTISKLKEIYYNIYSEKKFDKLLDKDTKKLGWHTNLATKPKMMYELASVIGDNLIKINSIGLLKELIGYQSEDLNTVRFDEEQTNHWDMVIALAIAFQMRNYATRYIEISSDNENFNPYGL